MVVFPPCKINLGLQVIQKRPDGYHDLETCFYPVPWTDILEVIVSKEFSFSSSGNTIPGRMEENLCVRAYHMLKKDFALPPVNIHLHKIIPTGAGLGGGSSNAAWTLRLLNEIFQLNLSGEKLTDYASQLGSDCAFFVHDKPMIGSGRGDVLMDTSVNLSGKFLILLVPPVHVSTAEAYGGIIPQMPEVSLRDILEHKPLTEWPGWIKNDFEKSVFEKYPVIRELKEKLYSAGAAFASMSGSGSSVFGIFEKEPDRLYEFGPLTSWCGKIESVNQNGSIESPLQ